MHATEFASRRRSLHLSQAELAQRLGVHSNTLAQWERGEHPIGRPQMVKAMLEVIEQDLREEPEEVRRARDERWYKRLLADAARLEAALSPEEREAARLWFSQH